LNRPPKSVWKHGSGKKGTSGLGRVGLIEVEGQGEVGDVGAGVARGQGSEAKAPFDQLEDGCVVEHPMIHMRIVLHAASEGRSDDHGNTKAQQRFAADQIGVHVVGCRGAGRRHVLKEAAPLVEGDQYGAIPRGTAGDGLEGVIEKAIAAADVSVRMVIVAQSVVDGGEIGIDVGDRGKSAIRQRYRVG
jgi:hypothetical protein